MELLWDSAVSQEERRNLINRLPLVSKTIALIFYQVSHREIIIPSRRISKLDRSHPLNTSCKSLHFHVDRDSDTDRATERAIRMEPLEMGLQWKALDYFNGKYFLSKGLFPNLTHIVINIHGHTLRYTPIRYPSTPHKLKRLTVTGLRWTISVRYRVTLARLWESLFEVEELIVEGRVMPIGKDAPWSLDVNQACNMIVSGCKGIRWNWFKKTQWRPSDERLHFYWDWENTHEDKQWPGRWLRYLERLLIQLLHPDFPRVERPIRRLKSFSHLQGIRSGLKITPIRRTKSYTELTTTGYPYRLRVWYPTAFPSFSRYTWNIRNSSMYATKLDEIWESGQEVI
ncbi:hypothetical protein Clacol_005705 [Clathrus columnatus]|uniref:Uncharacterized protein n=1 Tax=Clathrus columnatus TaxID=1419009 RepID=A0AAV5ACZ5_9AGAM|nr:hypothetical protein Clacol_005705 [Clathrus columnatus]